MFPYAITSYPLDDNLDVRVLALARFLNLRPEAVVRFEVQRFLDLEALMNFVALFGS